MYLRFGVNGWMCLSAVSHINRVAMLSPCWLAVKACDKPKTSSRSQQVGTYVEAASAAGVAVGRFHKLCNRAQKETGYLIDARPLI